MVALRCCCCSQGLAVKGLGDFHGGARAGTANPRPFPALGRGLPMRLGAETYWSEQSDTRRAARALGREQNTTTDRARAGAGRGARTVAGRAPLNVARENPRDRRLSDGLKGQGLGSCSLVIQ